MKKKNIPNLLRTSTWLLQKWWTALRLKWDLMGKRHDLLFKNAMSLYKDGWCLPKIHLSLCFRLLCNSNRVDSTSVFQFSHRQKWDVCSSWDASWSFYTDFSRLDVRISNSLTLSVNLCRYSVWTTEGARNPLNSLRGCSDVWKLFSSLTSFIHYN